MAPLPTAGGVRGPACGVAAALRAFLAAGLALALTSAAGCGTAEVGEGTARPTPGPGQPAASAQAPRRAPPMGYFIYEVRRGDTLFSLGERFRVPWRDLAALNGISRPEDMRVGRPLVVPQMEGVKLPEAPARQAEPAAAGRTAVAQADLHRGKPGSRFWWPTQGRVVRSYGDKVRGLAEPGMGLAAPAGLEVYAVAAGTVTTLLAADQSLGSPWGNVIAISHPGGMTSWYAQLGRALVARGAKVKQGQAVGTVGVGADGRPGVAFRLFHDDRPVDPEDYLP